MAWLLLIICMYGLRALVMDHCASYSTTQKKMATPLKHNAGWELYENAVFPWKILIHQKNLFMGMYLPQLDFRPGRVFQCQNGISFQRERACMHIDLVSNELTWVQNSVLADSKHGFRCECLIFEPSTWVNSYSIFLPIKTSNGFGFNQFHNRFMGV